MPITDKDILYLLKTEKSLALNLLFKRYYKPLCVFAIKYVDDLELAEDIVQEVFIHIWEKDYEYKNLSSFLFTSVRNACISYLRKKAPEYLPMVEDLLHDEPCDNDSMEELSEKLFKALDELPEKCRKVFKAVVLCNMKYKEVAEELNISVNTVKSNLARAYRLLRESLDVLIVYLLV